MSEQRKRKRDDDEDDRTSATVYDKMEKKVKKMVQHMTSSTTTARSDDKSQQKKNKQQKTFSNSINKTNDNSSPHSSSSKPHATPSSSATVPVNPNSPYTNPSTIYISGLPFTCTEDDIREFFKAVGTIKSIRLPKWHDSGKLRGYGHVEFTNASAAEKALLLNGNYLKERYIQIDRPMTPRSLQGTAAGTSSASVTPAATTSVKPPGCTTIFMKNLPYDSTEEEIKKAFMVYGPIKSIRLGNWQHTKNLKGFGYIDFQREGSAEIAVKKNGSITLKERVIAVDYETGQAKRGYKDIKPEDNKNKKFDK